jgi:hypothetical protein
MANWVTFIEETEIGDVIMLCDFFDIEESGIVVGETHEWEYLRVIDLNNLENENGYEIIEHFLPNGAQYFGFRTSSNYQYLWARPYEKVQGSGIWFQTLETFQPDVETKPESLTVNCSFNAVHLVGNRTLNISKTPAGIKVSGFGGYVQEDGSVEADEKGQKNIQDVLATDENGTKYINVNFTADGNAFFKFFAHDTYSRAAYMYKDGFRTLLKSEEKDIWNHYTGIAGVFDDGKEQKALTSKEFGELFGYNYITGEGIWEVRDDTLGRLCAGMEYVRHYEVDTLLEKEEENGERTKCKFEFRSGLTFETFRSEYRCVYTVGAKITRFSGRYAIADQYNDPINGSDTVFGAEDVAFRYDLSFWGGGVNYVIDPKKYPHVDASLIKWYSLTISLEKVVYDEELETYIINYVSADLECTDVEENVWEGELTFDQYDIGISFFNGGYNYVCILGCDNYPDGLSARVYDEVTVKYKVYAATSTMDVTVEFSTPPKNYVANPEREFRVVALGYSIYNTRTTRNTNFVMWKNRIIGILLSRSLYNDNSNKTRGFAYSAYETIQITK